jgi:hypothetical protein
MRIRPRRAIYVSMKAENPELKPDDIELHPDAWERFIDAVKRVARHPPVEKPKPKYESQKRRSVVHERKS